MDILRLSEKKFMKQPKRIILTHGDADGLVAAKVIEKCESSMLNCEFCWLVISSMNPSSEETERMFDRAVDILPIGIEDRIYIVDRAMLSKEYVEKKKKTLERTEIIYIDHHLTNKPGLYKEEIDLKNIINYWDDSESGATLSLRWFEELQNFDSEKISNFEEIKKFTNIVKLWDIFQWAKLPEDSVERRGALMVNAFEKIFSPKFLYKKLSERDFELEKIEELMEISFEIYNEDYNRYAKGNMNRSFDYKYDGKYIKIFYGFERKYQSLFSHEILSKDEADIVVFINPYGTVSFRSREDIDVGDLAKSLGEISKLSGGGHKTAANYKMIEQEKVVHSMVEKFVEDLKILAEKENKEFIDYKF